MLAQLACGITAVQDNTVRIFGTEGWIEVPSPWFCSGRQGGRSVIRIHTPAGTSEEIATETTDWLYSIEADAFAEGLERGEPIHPVANAADTLGNMRTPDAARPAAETGRAAW